MFSALMVNTWLAATIVAVVAGVVGFFTVLRGSTFVAHAVPQSAFAGAAGASLLGINTILGLGVFAVLGAVGIGMLGRRGRHDVATALAVVVMLGLGSLFLSMSTEYAPEIYSLLFGEVYGVSRSDLLPIAGLGLVCIIVILVLFRPLMLSSVVADVGEARGVRSHRMEMAFLVVVAVATTMAVPVVGALLIFSLLIGPPAAARSFANRPGVAMLLSVVIAVATVWASIAASYLSNLPIAFFVGAIGAGFYGLGRAWTGAQRARPATGFRSESLAGAQP
jgi:zinc/manganese transport system permease protein